MIDRNRKVYIGDVFRVVDSIEEIGEYLATEKDPTFAPDMKIYLGKHVTIDRIDANYNMFRIKEDRGLFLWSRQMLNEPIVDYPDFYTSSNDEIKLLYDFTGGTNER